MWLVFSGLFVVSFPPPVPARWLPSAFLLLHGPIRESPSYPFPGRESRARPNSSCPSVRIESVPYEFRPAHPHQGAPPRPRPDSQPASYTRLNPMHGPTLPHDPDEHTQHTYGCTPQRQHLYESHFEVSPPPVQDPGFFAFHDPVGGSVPLCQLAMFHQGGLPQSLPSINPIGGVWIS